MSTIESLLSQLFEHQITLRADGDRLLVNAPKGAMTQDLASEIRGRKGELLRFLHRIQNQYHPIPTAPGKGPFPLSFAQQRLWIIEKLFPGTTAYNIPSSFTLRGSLNRQALEMALAAMVQRHASLRTTFAERENQPIQVVHDQLNIPLGYQDVSDKENPVAVMQAWIDADRVVPFDLEKGPLLRVSLFKLGPEYYGVVQNMHHIVSDGWSFIIFIRELGAFYQSFLAGEPSPLPPMPLQYSDFAVWQRHEFAGEGLQRQLEYWKSKLAGCTSLELPTDFPRPKRQTFNGGRVALELDHEVMQALKELMAKDGSTLFMTMLAAFQAILARYSGQEDILVGTPIANRNRAEIEGIIGFFVNTLVLRSHIGAETSFSELLSQMRHTTLEAFTNQDLPFEQIVEALQPERDMSKNPIFQVSFSLVHGHDSPTFVGLQVEAAQPKEVQSHFDMVLSLVETPNHIEGTLVYNRDLFRHETATRMVGHYLQLLEAVSKAPDLPLRKHSLLTEAEKQRWLVAWNQRSRPVPLVATLHRYFEAVAAANLNQEAILFGQSYLTYPELDQASNQLAHHLKALGVDVEDCVGCCYRRSPQWIVAMLAIYKAGGVYVPLDPKLPAERLAYLLADTQAKWVLTENATASNLPKGKAKICNTDAEAPLIQRQAKTALPDLTDASSAAYVIYTSGSTGKPKGVLVPHGAAVIHLRGVSEHYGITRQDRVLQFASLGFDVSIEQTLTALFNGATLFLRDGDVDPSTFSTYAARNRISVANLPTAFWNQWVSAPETRRTQPDPLRLVMPGGEALFGERVAHWKAIPALDRVRLMNVYGPTETVITATGFTILKTPPQDQPVSIGAPFANRTGYVLDRFGQPSLPGTVGELCLGGPALARGYLAKPRLTAAAFIPDPFGRTPGSRLYRTGDLVRLQPDGEQAALAFVGRLDRQVKVRGYRIELDEIIAHLLSLQGVTDAAVVVQGKGDLAKLVGFAQTTSATPDHLRQHLETRLPSYMVPTQLNCLTEFPKTPNGKVDTKALLASLQTEVAQETFVMPTGSLQLGLVAIWREVLGVEMIGAKDNFFRLGGHSLLATRVVFAVRQAFSVDLPISAIFENPTVASLAGAVEALRDQDLSASRANADDSMGDGPQPVPRDGELPLSYAQQRLWFIEYMAPGQSPYLIPSSSLIYGALDATLLYRALDQVIERHEVLRTTFSEGENGPVQVVHSTFLTRKVLIDLSDLNDPRQHFQSLVDADIRVPFDLAKGPLVRFQLYRLADREHGFLLTFHHIVSDAWSYGIFLRELIAFYGNLTSGNGQTPAPLPIQYADYAVWQRRWFEAGELERQLSFWKKHLEDFQPLEFPLDFPRPKNQTFPGAHWEHTINLDLTRRLTAFSAHEKASMFMTTLAIFKVLLSHYTRQNDILIGTPVANRTRPEVENLIGFFVNSLLLRNRFDAAISFRELLQRVRQNTLNAFAHQDLPFNTLVEILQPERDVSRNPLFQISFSYDSARKPVLDGTVRSVPVEPSQSPAHIDLAMVVFETPDQISLGFRYNTDLFQSSTIARFAEHYTLLLAAILDNPDLAIHRHTLLSQPEVTDLLASWGEMATPYSGNTSLTAAFEQIARATPDAIALWDGQQVLSYAQLEGSASRFATYLRNQGVGVETPVGLCLRRSMEAVIAMLGILKAGGYYVPIDPHTPAERMAFMFADSKVSHVVTRPEFSEDLREFKGTLISFRAGAADPTWDLVQSMDAAPAGSFHHPDQLAYMIYTSGSTGKPKGVAMSHRGAMRMILGQPWVGIGASSIVGQTVALSFDPHVIETWGALLGGAQLVIFSDPQPTVDALGSYNLRHGITHTVNVTSLFHEMVDLNLAGYAALECMIVGGEAMDPVLGARAAQAYPNLRLFNAYGPTENAVVSTVHRVTSAQDRPTTMPIGRAILHASAYVLNPLLTPRPCGVAGELMTGGDGLARGYFGNPRTTAERFIPHPFSSQPGERLYRTGDLVRSNTSGEFEFLGRLDRQVKVRGFRIELGDIEAAISSHPTVRDAVVLVEKGAAQNDARLVAFVVGQADTEVDIASLQEHITRLLPEYMVPQQWVALQDLPKTTNGKIDQAALLRMTPQPTARTSSEPPATELERKLAEIWMRILKLEGIGRGDNFFALGGHSLLAARIVSAIFKDLGLTLTVKDFFKNPTLATLAALLTQQNAADAARIPKLLPLQRDSAHYPLSYAQQRMWFIDRFESGSTAYLIPSRMRVHGPFNLKAFESALNCIVERHEVFRTSFPKDQSPPVQVIHPYRPITLPLLDLSLLSETEREARIREIVTLDSTTPIDLTSVGAWRCQIVKVSPDHHALLLTLHHIISDGWSMHVLGKELAHAYRAFCSGATPSLTPLPIQYLDFAMWQRDWFASGELARQLAWWQTYLETPVNLDLPTDRPRQAVQTFRGAMHAFRMPSTTAANLHLLNNATQGTPFMSLLAAFQVLLSRYSGQSDILVGTPVANRNRSETEGLIGFFVNTLVLRARIDNSQSFRQFLTAMREDTLSVMAHQDIPFDKLIEELHPERDLSRNPIIQVFFSYQDFAMGGFDLTGLRTERIANELVTSHVDLTLNIFPHEGSYQGQWVYNADLFDAATLARMSDHFLHLLDSLTAQPDVPMRHLSLVSPLEQKALLEWGQHSRPYPAEQSIAARFESFATANPNAHALEYPILEGELVLSYGELNQLANRLAHCLIQLGVNCDDRVGIQMARSWETVLAMLAVLKAGGAYVPLDPEYPVGRLTAMAEDADLKCLITNQSQHPYLGEDTHVLNWDAFLEAAPSLPAESPATPFHPDQLAYVTFTSGSTGRPKPVGLTHRGVMRLACTSDRYAFTSKDRVAQCSNMVFDAATLEIWSALLNGAALVGFTRDQTLATSEMKARLREKQITILIQTTALFNQHLTRDPRTFESVEAVLFGGEATDPGTVRAFFEAASPATLSNLYGPTEATSICLWHPIAASPAPGSLVPIGSPCANNAIYLLSRWGDAVPAGLKGQLCIGGDGLARGYLGQPRLTAEKFTPNPFPLREEGGERLYQTGDLARHTLKPDQTPGPLVFQGRMDHQVKIRGYRIEPGEIEKALMDLEVVSEALVLVHKDVADGTLQLIAYLVGPTQGQLGTCRSQLQKVLPDYMLPNGFVALDAMPLTPSGKINREALRQLPVTRVDADSNQERIAPRTELERGLVEIWQTALKRKDLGIRDPFFEMGGHSLLATQVITQIRGCYGVELPIRAIFESPTIEKLAILVDSALRNQSGLAEIPLAPVDRSGFLPLSFAQERLWFLDKFDGSSATYNIPVSVRLKGLLSIKNLHFAALTLLQRHEILRTTYHEVDGLPRQHVQSCPTSAFSLIDLSGLTPAKAQHAQEHVLNQSTLTAFNLETGPVFRMLVVRTDQHTHALHTCVHHIASDGWSQGVFSRELDQVYRNVQLMHAEGTGLEVPQLQYGDFAHWQRHHLDGDLLARQAAYWQTQLAGPIPPLELATDYPRGKVRTYSGATHFVPLNAETSERLREYARNQGVSLFMLLVSGFKLLLHRLTGQDDITVGTPIAGRNRSGTETLLGCFLNTLVLRTRFETQASEAQRPASSFESLLKNVRETTLEAYAHQDVPFEKLLEILRVERDLSRTPLFQVFFNMVNLDMGSGKLGDLEMEALGVADIGSKFDITIYAGDSPDGIGFNLSYNRNLFDRQRMQGFGEQLGFLFSQIAAAPTADIYAFDLVTPAMAALLPQPTAPLDNTWHGPIHQWLTRGRDAHPARLAAFDPNGAMTYADLDRWSNFLAGELTAQGLAKGEAVGIYAHRSLPVVAAIFGVLKAGGCFVMLDPAYPAQRLLQFLEVGRVKHTLEMEAAGALPAQVTDYLRKHGLANRRLHLAAALPDAELLATWPLDPPEVELGPRDLAYIAFTSGSTGKPKGVMGLHGPLSHYVPWWNKTFAFGEHDRFSMLSGLSHDPLQRDIFTPIAAGATLAIPDAEDIAPGRLAKWLGENKVSVLTLTPSMGQIVAEADPGTQLPYLRQAFFVGEALTRRDLVRLRQIAPNVACTNYYGSTETQRSVGFYQISSLGKDAYNHDLNDPMLHQVLPLGKGVPDVQLLVLNCTGKLAGLGEAGEVYLRSPNLAAGYLGDEALSATRFLTNPFTQDPNDTIYRTGDLGRYLPDGNVSFMGRADFQIKIRGFRVEPGEIEAALVKHEAIHEALVIAKQRPSGDLYLVAYLVRIKGTTTPDNHSLKLFLLELLPDFMVPQGFVWVDAWPLNPNKKIDRQVLEELTPSLEVLLGGDEKTLRGPETQTERVLQTIWSEALGLDQVGLDDNFFDLGGHSLLATRILSRVRHRLGVDMPLKLLFQKPTIGALAAWLDTQTAGDLLIQGPVPVPRKDASVLSPAQQRLWFLQKLEPESPAYGITLPFELRGPLNRVAFENAYAAVIARHESLRTNFPEINALPVARVDLANPGAFAIVHRTYTDKSEALQNLSQDLAKPFALATDPLIRCYLYHLADDHHLLLVHMHHIISDGWSVGVFFQDLSLAYTAFCKGEKIGQEVLPIQYIDYAEWHHQWLTGSRMQKLTAFWKEHLAGAPHILDLPCDFPRPKQQTYRGNKHTHTLAKTLPPQLAKRASERDATAFMLFLAAFQTLIYRYTGLGDFLVGTPVANRNHPSLENLIGFFVNTLVLRTGVEEAGGGGATFNQLLDTVRQRTLEAFDHQDLTFDKLVELLQPERDLSRNPLIQVNFIFQSAVQRDIAFAELELDRIPLHASVSQFDLTLTVLPLGPETVHLAFEYNTDLFEAETIARMGRHFEHILAGVAANPDQRLLAIPLIDDAERLQCIAGPHNQTTRDYPRETGIHQLIESQVHQSPDTTALAFAETAWSYLYLNQEANRIANALHQLGIGQEMLVGICLTRSPWMVAAMLGVLKAGAAYVPLDPGHPKKRLEMIVEDAALTCMVVDETTQDLWANSDLTLVSAADAAPAAQQAPHLPHFDARQTAYVIYTSGSTGRPKGVAVHHRSVVNFLLGMQKKPGLNANDVLLAVTTLAFDISGLEIYLPLITGAQVIPAASHQVTDPQALVTLMAKNRVTVMQATPATWRMLFAAGWHGNPSLKVLCGGEALPQDLANHLAESCAAVWNVYGPTETTIWSTRTQIQAGNPVHIGLPMENTTVYVLDPQGHMVPQGLPGELFIGGEGLARGYRGRPDLTATRFLPDPFSEKTGARMYRTGDWVRSLREGQLLYLDRMDFQVKLRGFRIELGDIDAALRNLPGIREAVTLLRQMSVNGEDKRLVAFLVAQEPHPNQTELRLALAQVLPPYMVPSAFVFLEKLPLNTSGKLDRVTLGRWPLQNLDLSETRVPFVPPTNALQKRLCDLWAELLGKPQVGLLDNFFELGGHSLLSVQLMSRILESFGVDLPITALFQAPTPGMLAEMLRNGDQLRNSVMVPIKAEGEGTPVFLAHTVLGGIMGYRELIPFIKRPLYAFESPGLSGNGDFIPTVEAMAAHYIALMKTIQPEGPYAIGGWSMGGIVALEMAKQLTEAGDALEQVYVIDTIPWLEEADDAEIVRRFTQVQSSRNDLVTREELLPLEEDARLDRVLQILRATFPKAVFDRRYLSRLYQVYKNNQIAAQTYRPSYRGQVLVLRATERDHEPFNQAWSVSDIPHLMVNLPGDHLTLMFPPNVQHLAAYLDGGTP